MGFYRCMPDGSVSPSFNKQGFYRCYPAVSGGDEVWLKYFKVRDYVIASALTQINFYYDVSNPLGSNIQYSGKQTTIRKITDNILSFNTAARDGSSIYLNANCVNTFDSLYSITNSDWSNLVKFFNFSLIEDGSNMFMQCYSFNQSVNLPNLTNGDHIFYGCTSLNQPVNLPSLVNGRYMFSMCNGFNQPVNLPSLVDGSHMFSSCWRFNQPVNLPSLVNGYNMFFNCNNFNQPVNLPSLVNGSHMFKGCYRYNQPVTIPNTVNNFVNMFDSCTNMGSNIYINYNSSLTREKFVNMLRAKNNSKQINIFCNNTYVLRGTTASTSIVGASIGWSTITNGYRNTAYNIYLYNNYSG